MNQPFIRRADLAIAAAPVASLADDPLVHPSHSCLAVLGETFQPLSLSWETGGALTTLIWTSPVASRLPRHCHQTADEVFVVLEGAVAIQADGGFAVTAYPGDYVFLPKGVPHTHRATGGAPSRALQLLTPGGIEGALAEVAALLPEQVTPATLTEIAARYQLSLLPEA